MGRPKCYTTQAERQAAYRRRLRAETVLVDRRALDRLHAQLDRLHTAIRQAKRAGNPLATQVCAGSTDLTIIQLICWFESQGKEENLPK